MIHANATAAWITVALLVCVILFFTYLLYLRYRNVKDAKETLEASRNLHRSYGKMLEQVITQLQEIESGQHVPAHDRDAASVFKKYCKFIAYPARVEVEIDVGHDATHISVIHADGLQGQKMYALKLKTGQLSTLVHSSTFKESCALTGFHIHGY